ncbi:ABC transporter permease [Actinocrinis puniceicyclus]|uniref:ABC transporter permease n=1 Tax=Actinocrinis puniceicyclus TaxID=977794 RepID=A0A8J7WLM4_9ACTN|nr:ABC transporter permease [Actinocrinis puniceicyclus]MBS2961755.1 ABC transporter permease [Actinocrinis puniceicyclus]
MTATAAELTAPAARGLDRARLIPGLAQAAVGAYALWAFGLGARTASGAKAAVGMALNPNAPGALGMQTFPAAPVAIALSLVCVVCGVARAFAPLGPAARRGLTVGYVVSFVLAFLVWASAGTSTLGGVSLPGVLNNTLIVSVPLILGALCGIICERSGVVNVAIEGQFLFGAFSSAMAATMSGSVWIGLVVGALSGALLGSLLAVLANRYHIEQVVLGVVLNLFALGLTNFLYDKLLSPKAAEFNQPPVFQAIRIPGLADIPVIGPVLFDQNILFYLTFLIIAVLQVGLFRTRWGLRTRAVGEHPRAADTVGIKVLGTRYRNVVMAGLISGLGGVWLTIGQVGSFTTNMSAGKGFIALAALIVGRWSPVGALGAALLFGFAGGLNNALAPLGTPLPGQVLSMAPYLATVFVVASLGGIVRAPAAENQPYVKD